MPYYVIGYFVGNFFGKKDSWTKQKKDLMFFSEEEARLLFKDFDLIQFREIEKDGKTASGKEKHWHIYYIIAKKIKKL